MFKKLFGARSQSQLIDRAFEKTAEMLLHAGKMNDLAIAVLLHHSSQTVDFEALDDLIDEGEREVRRLVLEHLALHPRHDLVASVTLISLVQDAERLGDFARGLAELKQFERTRIGGEFADELGRMAERIRPNFEVCAAAFNDDDAESAEKVLRSHLEIREAVRAFLTRLANSDESADHVLIYTNAVRVLGRVSAHLSNIAASVVEPYDRIREGDEEL